MTSVPILALDVDGVLIRGWPERKWHTNLLEDFGFHPSVLEENLFKPHWPEIVVGEKQMLPILEEVLSEISTTVKAPDILAYWFDDSRHLRSDVVDAALAWRDRSNGKIFLATNQEELHAAYLWNDLGLSQVFDGIAVSCDLGIAKPHPRFFESADRVMEVMHPSHVYFIDDLQENVTAAQRHGWDALCATDPADIVSAIADCT